MTKFTLNSVSKASDSNEDLYSYKAEDGSFILFSAHPKQAFVWVIHATNLKARTRNKVLNAFVEAGMGRGQKSFDEAIAILAI
jgi:hypothetical protein